MKCCKCGDSIEIGKSFRPVDKAGTPNRRWICNECQGIEKETVESVLLGKEDVDDE